MRPGQRETVGGPTSPPIPVSALFETTADRLARMVADELAKYPMGRHLALSVERGAFDTITLRVKMMLTGEQGLTREMVEAEERDGRLHDLAEHLAHGLVARMALARLDKDEGVR